MQYLHERAPTEKRRCNRGKKRVNCRPCIQSLIEANRDGGKKEETKFQCCRVRFCIVLCIANAENWNLLPSKCFRLYILFFILKKKREFVVMFPLGRASLQCNSAIEVFIPRLGIRVRAFSVNHFGCASFLMEFFEYSVGKKTHISNTR